MAKYKVGDKFKGNKGSPFGGWTFKILGRRTTNVENFYRFEYTTSKEAKEISEAEWSEYNFDTYTYQVDVLKDFINTKLKEKGFTVVLS